MKIFYRKVLIFILLSFTFLFSCADLDFDFSEEIKFTIVSVKAGFIGSYRIEGGALQTIDTSEIVNSNDNYSYEKTINDLTGTLEISATTLTGATSITITIYKDGHKEKTRPLDNISETSTGETITLDYDITEDTTDSDGT